MLHTHTQLLFNVEACQWAACTGFTNARWYLYLPWAAQFPPNKYHQIWKQFTAWFLASFFCKAWTFSEHIFTVQHTGIALFSACDCLLRVAETLALTSNDFNPFNSTQSCCSGIADNTEFRCLYFINWTLSCPFRLWRTIQIFLQSLGIYYIYNIRHSCGTMCV